MTDFSFDKQVRERLAAAMESYLDGIEHYAAEKIATLPIEDVSARLNQLGLDETRAIEGVEKYLALRGERVEPQDSDKVDATSTLHNLLFDHDDSSEHDNNGHKGDHFAGSTNHPIRLCHQKIGSIVVTWLETAGERYLKKASPEVLQLFLLHVGGTDILRSYNGSPTYWQYVQVILDCFFTADQRADMCAELFEVYRLDRNTLPTQFFSEIAAQQLIGEVRKTKKSCKNNDDPDGGLCVAMDHKKS